jgi:hypothetical protein
MRTLRIEVGNSTVGDLHFFHTLRSALTIYFSVPPIWYQAYTAYISIRSVYAQPPLCKGMPETAQFQDNHNSETKKYKHVSLWMN